MDTNPSPPATDWAHEVESLRERNAQLSSELHQVVQELQLLRNKIVHMENMPWIVSPSSAGPSLYHHQQQQQTPYNQEQQHATPAILVAVSRHPFQLAPNPQQLEAIDSPDHIHPTRSPQQQQQQHLHPQPIIAKSHANELRDSAGTSITNHSTPSSPSPAPPPTVPPAENSGNVPNPSNDSNASDASNSENDKSSESSEKVHIPAILQAAEIIQKKTHQDKHRVNTIHASPAIKKASAITAASHHKKGVAVTPVLVASSTQKNHSHGPSRSKKEPRKQIAGQSRYWTTEEHKLFLEALKIYGHKDLRAISNFVGTRNMTQVRTHTQKYFMKLMREAKRRQESEGQDAADTKVPMSPLIASISMASTPANSPDWLDLSKDDRDRRHEDVRSVPETCGVSLLSMVAQATR